MRAFAVEGVLDGHHSGRVTRSPGDLEIIADVREEDDVHILETACTHQVCLGPEQLFTDARPELDRASDLGSLHQPFDRDRGRDVEGLTRIMTLAVSRRAIDQRLVTSDARFLRSLGDAIDVRAERDHRFTRSPSRHPCRGNARNAAFDREAFFLEDFGQILRSLELLKPQLSEAEDHVVHHLASFFHRVDVVDDLLLVRSRGIRLRACRRRQDHAQDQCAAKTKHSTHASSLTTRWLSIDRQQGPRSVFLARCARP